ncbi:MAG: hypothetical protein GQ533_10740 [Methanosarcinaceae archaeon]|nr:hypothetical protein [Methanosarcinaceae archaeon]
MADERPRETSGQDNLENPCYGYCMMKHVTTAEQAPTPKRGTYILAKVGEQLITIGHGLAEKVLVE